MFQLAVKVVKGIVVTGVFYLGNNRDSVLPSISLQLGLTSTAVEEVRYLEDQGLPDRDLKPDNIGIDKVGCGSKLHLILFNFSLSRTSPENTTVGTPGYPDPMLPLRKPPRWDLQAERYAVGWQVSSRRERRVRAISKFGFMPYATAAGSRSTQ